MLGRDVSGEARGAAHPSGTASILAGLQSLVFLSSGFYSAHTPAVLGSQLKQGNSSPLADWRCVTGGCWLNAVCLSFPSQSWKAAFRKCHLHS